MDFNSDHFALFNLPRQFVLVTAELDARYREIQTQVHPDRFANAGDAERRLSMQWATRANEAYQTLKKPMERAKYLLELAGHDIQAENNTAMAADFLMEQMEWREAVMEARQGGDHHELERLHNRLRSDITSRYGELGELLDVTQNHVEAIDRVRRLMFLEKLLYEIDDALASLEE
jgi:molecular chaperone HscB